MGLATAEEIAEVEALSADHAEIRNAIDEFSLQLEAEALANAVTPDPTIKPLLMATLNFIDRMEKGEQPSNPPMLGPSSKVEDYNEWLNRPDMRTNESSDEVFARIIAHTPTATTAIVWLKDMAPQEVHDNEFERFLIVEGTCDIIVGDQRNSLSPGDYFEIPLHKNHEVRVTSLYPCKVILQRVAA